MGYGDRASFRVEDNPVSSVAQERRRFTTSFQTVQVSGNIDSNCAEIFFINKGTANVKINNTLELTPEQSFGVGSNLNELDVTDYNCVFANTGVPKLVIIKRNYQEL
ncbi:MAG: hypothetical protein ABW007_02080 [Chitinophagaceae bacterium]